MATPRDGPPGLGVWEGTAGGKFSKGEDMTPQQFRDTVDPFTRGYVDCAFWLTMFHHGTCDANLDEAGFSIEDCSEDLLDKLVSDCATFQREQSEHISEAYLLRTPDHDWLGTYGHDLWLTRNGHGAGYWDGDYAEPHATALDRAAKAMGAVELYVGDDGRIYC